MVTWIDVAVGAAWVQIVAASHMTRYGHVAASEAIELSHTNGGAVLTTVDDRPQLIFLQPNRELWARQVAAPAQARGSLVEYTPPGPFGDYTALNYQGRSLPDYVAGSHYIARVSPCGCADFTSIQDAADHLAPLVSATQWGLIDIAPGEYTENVVLPRFVAMRGLTVFGPSYSCVLRSTSGDTLRIPPWECLINGLAIISDSAVPGDAALRMYDDGLPPNPALPTFGVNFLFTSTAGAHALILDAMAGNPQMIAIYGGMDILGACAEAIQINAGSTFIWFLGGGGGVLAATCAKVNAGGGLMVGNGVGMSADPAAGIVVDLDGGFFAGLDVRFDDGQDGIRGRNGSTAYLVNTYSFGGVPGVPVDMDATSTLITGVVQLNGAGSPPLGGWIVGGPWIQYFDSKQGIGTALGPDTRPAVAPLGYRFYAQDTAIGGGPGTGTWLTWNGAAWKTATDVIVP